MTSECSSARLCGMTHFTLSARFIKRFTGHLGSRVKTECLYRFNEPVSPALAARLAQDQHGAKVRRERCQPASFLTR